MPKQSILDQPANYQIKVQGALAAHWADYLSDLNINVNRAQNLPVTTLIGEITDQAALMGVLNHLYDMGFPILSVEYQGREEVIEA